MNQNLATRLIINGLVQGVGFRPSVYHLANRLGLKGWIKNTGNGVEIVISSLDASSFIRELSNSLPPLAIIDSISCEEYHLSTAITDFHILDSIAGNISQTRIAPDCKICSDCLIELFNPESRYYLYPFISCTNCGPRYTIIKNLPYDRINTSYKDFELCRNCNDDYNNPANRRYHAETSCCKVCGPSYNMELEKVANYIQDGKIIALKGTGGYVLIADAKNSEVISRLRTAKKRAKKPLAVMALNTISIRYNYAEVNAQEAALLETNTSPIVILKRKKQSSLPANIAPELDTLGIMLAHSPAYYLLFYYLLGKPSGYEWLEKPNDKLLIVTSANLSGEAIITDDMLAEEALSDIADYIISHNREITVPVDDSVMRMAGKHKIMLRHARGLTPLNYSFNYDLPQVLGVGASLKATLSFSKNNKIHISQYIGDLKQLPVIDYYQKIYQHYYQLYAIKPELIVCDLHPDFYTSQFATESGLPVLKLQHHNAHFAAVLGEFESYGYLLEQRILGCILDGYGYGNNGEALGGELIEFDFKTLQFKTISQLPELMSIGGDLAEKEPWRLALAMCIQYDLPIPEYLLKQPNANIILEILKDGNTPKTTAVGRIFSGVAALLGVMAINDYEANAAMLLESMVSMPETDFDIVRLTADGKPDIATLIRKVYTIGVTENNRPKAINLFYGSLTTLLDKWIVYHASLHRINQIALSGGCWQSPYLLSMISDKFQHSTLELLIPKDLPLNDECISFGQAWYGTKYTLLNGKDSLCV